MQVREPNLKQNPPDPVGFLGRCSTESVPLLKDPVLSAIALCRFLAAPVTRQAAAMFGAAFIFRTQLVVRHTLLALPTLVAIRTLTKLVLPSPANVALGAVTTIDAVVLVILAPIIRLTFDSDPAILLVLDVVLELLAPYGTPLRLAGHDQPGQIE